MPTVWASPDMRVHSMRKKEVEIWPVHFSDDIPRWRVVNLDGGVIVREQTFHDEEEALEYYNTLKNIHDGD